MILFSDFHYMMALEELGYDIIKAPVDEIRVESKEGDRSEFIVQMPVI